MRVYESYGYEEGEDDEDDGMEDRQNIDAIQLMQLSYGGV
ncbi:protein of unknown function [Alcaligenes faecalis subsp. faecalis]|nr:protein of unknown function [Alcaligenes faecalis subsp. faecalis]